MDAATKYHYYNFCYVIQEAGISKFVSQPVQLQSALLTVPVLHGVKASMQVPASGVLVSAVYLGHMTLPEFNPPQRAGMEASDEYMAGLREGMKNTDAKNPYENGTVEHMDWRNGRIKGFEMWEAENTPPSIDEPTE